jgi:cold shock CspA family protein
VHWSLLRPHSTHVAIKGSQGGNPLPEPCPLTNRSIAKEPGTRAYPAEGILHIAKLLGSGLLTPSNKNDIFNHLSAVFIQFHSLSIHQTVHIAFANILKHVSSTSAGHRTQYIQDLAAQQDTNLIALLS